MVLDADYYQTLSFHICCVHDFFFFFFFHMKHINLLIVFFEREDVDRR